MSVLMEPGEEETILERGGQSVVEQMVRPSLFFIGILVFSPRVIEKNDVLRLQTMSLTVEVRMVLTVTFRDSSRKHGWATA